MSTTGRAQRVDQGFGRSDQYTFTIPSGATGSAVTPINLLRNYAFLVVTCEDATGVASGTLGAQVSYDASGTMCALYQQDMAAIWASMTLPTSGTFAFVLSHAFGAQRLRFVASASTDADLVLKVYGFDATVQP